MYQNMIQKGVFSPNVGMVGTVGTVGTPLKLNGFFLPPGGDKVGTGRDKKRKGKSGLLAISTD